MKVTGSLASDPRSVPTALAVNVYSVAPLSPAISQEFLGATTRHAGEPSANEMMVDATAGPDVGRVHVRLARLHQVDVAARLLGALGADSSVDNALRAANGSTIPCPKCESHPGAPRSCEVLVSNVDTLTF